MEKQKIGKPNSENSAAMQYFDFVETIVVKEKEMKMYKCKLCDQSRNGSNPANLVSHLKTMHKDVYFTNVKKKMEDSNIKMQVKQLKLLQNCVEITTINKQPFSDLLNSGFQNIIRKKMLTLEASGYGLNLKCKNLTPVKNHIRETALKIRVKIAAEIKNRLFSLSADIVTKNNRSILGIFIQYISNGQLQNRCIGMKELHQRHTGKYLCDIVDDCVEGYGSKIDCIVSITTDNGSNMKTLITSLNALIVDQNTEDSDLVEENEQLDNEQNNNTESMLDIDMDENVQSAYNIQIATALNQIDEDDQNEINELANNLVPDESDWSFINYSNDIDLADSLVRNKSAKFAFVNGVNCAAHTIQLVIKDGLAQLSSNYNNIIKLCREACKFIRLQTTIYEMQNRNIKKKFPALDVETRWSSTYIMVSDHFNSNQIK